MPTEHAPAKVNLALHVLGRRPDGYHDLHSLCVFTELGDTLTAVPNLADRLALGGPFGGELQADRSNLIMRALAGYRARFPGTLPDGLALRLDKNVPVAAGLGGGSADAAAALRLFASMSTQRPPQSELLALAKVLGADVPMCLLSRSAEIGGIGEIVRPLPRFPAVHLVLANPGIPLATPRVFEGLANRDNPPMPALGEGFDAIASLAHWLGGTRNDLEAPAIALVPGIGDLIAALSSRPSCILARMSGSGASVFGLFGAAEAAHLAAHDLRSRFPAAWVAATPVLNAS